MAGNTVTLAFAGDTAQLDKALAKVGEGAKDMAADVDKASASMRSSGRNMSEGIGSVGEKADQGEQRIMGLKDSVEGAGAVMAGPGKAGIGAYLQGWADLASGVANFVVPAIKKIIETELTQVASAARAVAANVAAAATTVAGWVAQAAAAVVAGAQIAAAWLVSIAPIAAVIAAVALAAYVIYRNWDTITEAVSTAAGFIRDKIEAVVGFFQSIPGRLGDAMSTVADVLTAPYREAFQLIRQLWNGTIGGFSFSVPSWIPGVGGKGFTIPKMHTGGIVPGVAGTEVPIMAMAGERVSQGANGGGAGGGPTYNIYVLEPGQVVEAVRKYERTNGRVWSPA